MFPTVQELKDPPTNGYFNFFLCLGVYATWTRYTTFKERFGSLCEQLFPRGGKFGTHTCRKTAYLMAIWGGGTFESIMASARHRDIATAQIYERDARYLMEVAERNGFALKGTVSKWRPVLVQSETIARSLNERGSRHDKTLYNISKTFLEEHCRVSIASINFSVNYVIEMALSYNQVETTFEKVPLQKKNSILYRFKGS